MGDRRNRGGRRAARRVLPLLLSLAGLAGSLPASADAATGTVAISVPPDLIRLSPATITFSGTIDVPGRLLARAGGGACPFNQLSPGGPELLPEDGLPVGPGPFSVDVTHLFGERMVTSSDILCASLLADGSTSNVAFAQLDVSLRRPATSFAIDVPKLDVGVPATITVSGSSEAQRLLDVYYTNGCPATAADGDDVYGTVRMTAAGGVPVGPGPFSVAFSLTPTVRWSPQRICAFLSPPTWRTLPDGKASVAVRWSLPHVVLTSPADGAHGELLNPRFAWDPAEDVRDHPVSDDAVEFWRIEGDRRIPLLWMTTRRWRALSPEAARYMKQEGTGETDEMAYLDGSSFKLVGGFWPGTYEWSVTRAGHDSPPPRRFVVEAKPLREMRLTVKPQRGLTSQRPLFAQIDARTVPFVIYRRDYRIAGGPWRTAWWRSERSATTHDVIQGTCRQPGGRIAWRFTARDAAGTTLTRSGNFPNASVAFCARLKSEEAGRRREAARRRAERERREREQARRLAEQQVARFKRNCRAIGGTPVLVEGRWYCRADGGGLLLVPGF